MAYVYIYILYMAYVYIYMAPNCSTVKSRNMRKYMRNIKKKYRSEQLPTKGERFKNEIMVNLKGTWQKNQISSW